MFGGGGIEDFFLYIYPLKRHVISSKQCYGFSRLSHFSVHYSTFNLCFNNVIICIINLYFFSLRYILMDWMIEVAGMKYFSGHTLHASLCIVDRYLKVHSICRSRLQLLGVAAMVLCSR